MHTSSRILGVLSLGALAAIAGLTWHLAGAMRSSFSGTSCSRSVPVVRAAIWLDAREDAPRR
ncbi:MAG: hypothetical protein WKH68_09910 [Candidatus Limnocylindria bacterium]